MSRKFEDFLTPSSLCQTKMAVLIRSSYKVSQKIQRPSPFLRNVIYAWSFKQIQNIQLDIELCANQPFKLVRAKNCGRVEFIGSGLNLGE